MELSDWSSWFFESTCRPTASDESCSHGVAIHVVSCRRLERLPNHHSRLFRLKYQSHRMPVCQCVRSRTGLFRLSSTLSPHVDCHCGVSPCTVFSSGRFKVAVFIVAPPAGDGSADAASADAPHGEGTLALDEHVAALERGDTISSKVAVNAVNGSSGTYGHLQTSVFLCCVWLRR
jgi:hypothetical protein